MRRSVLGYRRIDVLPHASTFVTRSLWNQWWLLPMLLALHAIVAVDCAHVFQSYRVAQFDRSGGLAFGSRRATVNHVAMAASALSSNGDLLRTLVILRAGELSSSLLQQLVDARKASGLLVLLPANLTLADPLSFRQVEQKLLERDYDSAIYFAVEDEHLSGVVQSLSSQTFGHAVSEHFQFVASASEASLVGSVSGHNFQVPTACIVLTCYD